MKRSTNRILTTHAGSLPRPTGLEDALEQRGADQATYVATLRSSVADVVRKQAESGVDIVEAFLPVAAPASVEPGRVNEYYPSDEAYVHAIAEALKVEYDTIVGAGFLLQVDDAFIPYNYDRFVVQGMSMDDYKNHCQL